MLIVLISNLALAAPLPPSDIAACGNTIEALQAQFSAIQQDSFRVVVRSQEANRAAAHFQRCYLPQARQLAEQASPLQHVRYLNSMLYMADSQGHISRQSRSTGQRAGQKSSCWQLSWYRWLYWRATTNGRNNWLNSISYSLRS